MHVSDERTMLDAAEERGLEKGLKQGIQQGIQQGIEQITKEAVINFYKNKVSPEIIAKSLGLPIERINEIIESE